jgi:hypothetical protein
VGGRRETVARRVIVAADAKLAASTITALMGPTSATRAPATPKEMIEVVRSAVPCRPASRSSDLPDSCEACGTKATLAASPGPRIVPGMAVARRAFMEHVRHCWSTKGGALAVTGLRYVGVGRCVTCGRPAEEGA